MLAVGLLFKVGAAPFQAWMPDVYQGAPTAVTAFMAAATKVAAFGALLRLFYVAFGSARWAWQPMMWVIAILTMIVGTVLALVQSDMKRMLAYSSVAHTGFLLTGVLGLQSAAALGPDQLTSLQAVLFYLVTYGFTTLGAFAVVSLVRDSAGEQSTISRWAGLGKHSPVVAGCSPCSCWGWRASRSPPASPRSGRSSRSRCPRAPGRWWSSASWRSAAAAFFYVRVIVVMYFHEPDSESAYVAHPSVLTATAIGVAAAATLALGLDPGPGARPGAECGTIHQVTETAASDGAARLAMPVTDEALARRIGERLGVVEHALAGHVRSRAPFVTQAACHLMEAGGKRFRPLLVLLAAEAGAAPASDDVITAACVVELTHLASLYHDDVMDEAALRRGAESANARWDNHVAILTGDFLFSKSSELTAELGAGRRPHPGPDLHPAGRGPDPRDRQARRRRGPPGALPRRGGRQDRLADRDLGPLRRTLRRRAARGRGGADGVRRHRRHGLPALRRHPRRRLRLRGVRQDARHRPARRRADAAGADGAGVRRPEDARLLELLDSDLTDDGLHAEALALLRAHPAMAEARAYVVARAAEAKALLDGRSPPARSATALEAFADVVATRSA